jgi:hypothetical protein
MSVPKVATLNNLLAHHESKGTKPKCSVFHLLPNRLVMDIVKIELDRQRDTLEYWSKLIPKVIKDGTALRERNRCINSNIRALGQLNQSVKAVGYFKLKDKPPVYFYAPNGEVVGRFAADPESVRVPQKDCSPAQKKATKKTDINYSCAIIRHYGFRYQVKDYIRKNREVCEVIARMKSRVCSPAGDIDLYQVRIAKISIRVNYERHQ